MKSILFYLVLVLITFCAPTSVAAEFEKKEKLILAEIQQVKNRYGVEDLRILDSLDELKNLYQKQGLYKKSEPLQLQQLTILKKNYADDHPEVIKCWAEVVALFRITRSNEEADAVEKALARLSAENKNIITLAESGDKKVLYDICYGYRFARNSFSLNYKKANYWCTKSAQSDSIESMAILGELYRQGLGVDKNLDTAFDWYIKAAEKGHTDAQYIVGEMYFFGEANKADIKQAILWMELSIDGGNENKKAIAEVLEKIKRLEKKHNNSLKLNRLEDASQIN